MSVEDVVSGIVAGFGGEPDAEGWYRRDPQEGDGFLGSYGTIRVRREGERSARVRFASGARTANLVGSIHGGYLLALVDQALFVGPTVNGYRALGGATVDVSCQFLAPGDPAKDVDCVTEVLRETKRMLFVRGLIEQDGETKLAFSGTLRKPS